MRSVYLPLVPLPALAVLVAVSACTKPRSEEVSHVIPPPSYAAVSATAAAPAPTPAPRAAAAPDAAPEDGEPSAEEVKAFERPVRK